MSKLLDAMYEESEKEYQMQLEAERKQAEKIKKINKDDESLEDDETLEDETLEDDEQSEDVDLGEGDEDNA